MLRRRLRCGLDSGDGRDVLQRPCRGVDALVTYGAPRELAFKAAWRDAMRKRAGVLPRLVKLCGCPPGANARIPSRDGDETCASVPPRPCDREHAVGTFTTDA